MFPIPAFQKAIVLRISGLLVDVDRPSEIDREDVVEVGEVFRVRIRLENRARVVYLQKGLIEKICHGGRTYIGTPEKEKLAKKGTLLSAISVPRLI